MTEPSTPMVQSRRSHKRLWITLGAVGIIVVVSLALVLPWLSSEAAAPRE